ncbi:MAG: MoaD/ThiS family protein [Thermoguttaceae bacterium]
MIVSGRNYQLAEPFPDQLDLPEGTTLDDVLGLLSARFSPGRTFPPSCLLGVSGKHVGSVGSHRPVVLKDHDEIVIFAPVAGG